MTATASTISFLYSLKPGLSSPRMTWVIPALYPRKAIRCRGLNGSFFGEAFASPLACLHHLCGGSPSDPCRGYSGLQAV